QTQPPRIKLGAHAKNSALGCWLARCLRNRRRRRTEGGAQRSVDADSSAVSSARLLVASDQAESARTLSLAPGFGRYRMMRHTRLTYRCVVSDERKKVNVVGDLTPTRGSRRQTQDSGSERMIGDSCEQMGARIDAETKGSSAYAQADHGTLLRYGARSDSLDAVRSTGFGDLGIGTGPVT
ncbi:unnamed protein product, partial [Tilletia controversa]